MNTDYTDHDTDYKNMNRRTQNYTEYKRTKEEKEKSKSRINLIYISKCTSKLEIRNIKIHSTECQTPLQPWLV